MKINTGVVIAWVLSLSITAWIWSGSSEDTSTSENTAPILSSVPNVKTEWITSELVSQKLTLNGQTKAKRLVIVKPEIAGKIDKILVDKGDYVKRGQILATIDKTDLPSRIKSARALEEQRRLEYLGAKELNTKGFQNATQLAAQLAQYEQAKSQTISLDFQLNNTEIRAPFDGTVNNRMIEIGSFVRAGDASFEIVDFSSLLIEAQISENAVGKISVNQQADIELVQGATVPAVLSFIDFNANPQTRTYNVELEVTKPGKNTYAGSSATVFIQIAEQNAHFISPALLQLDDKGDLGVKVVNQNNVVEFINVDAIESTPGGVWVAGLPNETQIITVGHGFVEKGQEVMPTPATTSASN